MVLAAAGALRGRRQPEMRGSRAVLATVGGHQPATTHTRQIRPGLAGEQHDVERAITSIDQGRRRANSRSNLNRGENEIADAAPNARRDLRCACERYGGEALVRIRARYKG